MPVLATQTSPALVLVPAIISVAGVLVVAVLTALFSRRLHMERLRREEVVARRDAITTHMATWEQKTSHGIANELAGKKWTDVLGYIESHTWTDAQMAEVSARIHHR